jgi:hypothetical protein
MPVVPAVVPELPVVIPLLPVLLLTVPPVVWVPPVEEPSPVEEVPPVGAGLPAVDEEQPAANASSATGERSVMLRPVERRTKEVGTINVPFVQFVQILRNLARATTRAQAVVPPKATLALLETSGLQ